MLLGCHLGKGIGRLGVLIGFFEWGVSVIIPVRSKFFTCLGCKGGSGGPKKLMPSFFFELKSTNFLESTCRTCEIKPRRAYLNGKCPIQVSPFLAWCMIS